MPRAGRQRQTSRPPWSDTPPTDGEPPRAEWSLETLVHEFARQDVAAPDLGAARRRFLAILGHRLGERCGASGVFVHPSDPQIGHEEMVETHLAFLGYFGEPP